MPKQYLYEMTSRTERFQRKPREKDEAEIDAKETLFYFTTEEEAVCWPLPYAQ